MASFDPARIRHNFERSCGPVIAAVPERWAKMAPPRDPMPEARQLLDSLRALAERRYRAKWSLLEPFFADAHRLMTALETPTGLAQATPASDAKQGAKLREDLCKVLWDIEDLLEVVAEVGFG